MSNTNGIHLQPGESTGDANLPANTHESHLTAKGRYESEHIKTLFFPTFSRIFNETHDFNVDITNNSNQEIDNHVKGDNFTWMAGPDSHAIWIPGPHDAPHPSQNAKTAIWISSVAEKHKFPSILYYCSARKRASPRTSVSPRDLLLDVVKSFTMQLLLPSDEMPLFFNPEVQVDLSDSRLAQLVEPDIHFDTALEIFLDVRFALEPDLTFWVIEGAQALEDRRDAKHTRNLQRFLCEFVKPSTSWTRSQSPPGVVEATASRSEGNGVVSSEARRWERGFEMITKVCILSDGDMGALAELASQGEVKKVE